MGNSSQTEFREYLLVTFFMNPSLYAFLNVFSCSKTKMDVSQGYFTIFYTLDSKPDPLKASPGDVDIYSFSKHKLSKTDQNKTSKITVILYPRCVLMRQVYLDFPNLIENQIRKLIISTLPSKEEFSLILEEEAWNLLEKEETHFSIKAKQQLPKTKQFLVKVKAGDIHGQILLQIILNLTLSCKINKFPIYYIPNNKPDALSLIDPFVPHFYIGESDKNDFIIDKDSEIFGPNFQQLSSTFIFYHIPKTITNKELQKDFSNVEFRIDQYLGRVMVIKAREEKAKEIRENLEKMRKEKSTQSLRVQCQEIDHTHDDIDYTISKARFGDLNSPKENCKEWIFPVGLPFSAIADSIPGVIKVSCSFDFNHVTKDSDWIISQKYRKYILYFDSPEAKEAGETLIEENYPNLFFQTK